MPQAAIRYVSDDKGKVQGVLIPIKLWHEIESLKETAYLLKSTAMKKRLFEAKKRKKGVPFELVREKFGI
ncbi:MAG: prevent-host-death protein [Nitrospirae bacterium]|nr:prevent-host-death protein [Nitrospirota bacterium]